MKKKIICLVIFLLSMALVACTDSDVAKESPTYTKMTRVVSDDGWVFTFAYQDYKEPRDKEDGLIHFWFFGINLRYRYDEDYLCTAVVPQQDGTNITMRYHPGIVNWGFAEKNHHDAKIISDLLTHATEEELMELKPEDLPFTSLDATFFCNMVKETLSKEPHAESTKQSYWDRPGFAALAEAEFIDGYKFQVVYMQGCGVIDELYIDVLFEDKNEKYGYRQLSDLVEQGEADASQIEMFAEIKKIVEKIKEEDSYIAGREEYKKLMFGDVEFERLSDFLTDIHKNKTESYKSDPIYLE